MLGVNKLERDFGGRIRAVDTGERETLECGLVLRSIGYTGVPVPGVPFDEKRGTIANDAGQVADQSGRQEPGLYAVGWIKRGPSGVIGTNKKDAAETVDTLLEDTEHQRHELPNPEPESIEELIAERDPEAVTYAGWEAIDAAEVAGEPHGRPRVKFVSVEEMLEARQGRERSVVASHSTRFKAADRGVAARRRGRGRRRDRARGPPARDRQGQAVRGPLADRAAQARQGRGPEQTDSGEIHSFSVRTSTPSSACVRGRPGPVRARSSLCPMTEPELKTRSRS